MTIHVRLRNAEIFITENHNTATSVSWRYLMVVKLLRSFESRRRAITVTRPLMPMEGPKGLGATPYEPVLPRSARTRIGH
jgi:hypothetical protein